MLQRKWWNIINMFDGVLVQMSNTVTLPYLAFPLVVPSLHAKQAQPAHLPISFSSVCIADNYYALYEVINKNTEAEPLHFL
jgi:hypothetical protein